MEDRGPVFECCQCQCKCKKEKREKKCCVDLILTILISILTFTIGLIIGALTSIIVILQLGAIIAFAIIIALLIIIRIILLICKKTCGCKNDYDNNCY